MKKSLSRCETGSRICHTACETLRAALGNRPQGD
jgi:hypothetical protein